MYFQAEIHEDKRKAIINISLVWKDKKDPAKHR